VDDTLAVVHIVFVTLPVLETDVVGLIVADVHPDTVPVEDMLGVFVTVKVLVWHALSEGVVVTDGVKDGVRVPDPQPLVVILEVEESEPDTVVVTEELRDKETVPDPQALVVTLKVEECEPDAVGESVPLRVEEDVWDTEVLKDPDTVEDKHKVGEVLTEVVVDKDPVWVPEVQEEGVVVDEEHCEEETELDAEMLIVPLKVGLVE